VVPLALRPLCIAILLLLPFTKSLTLPIGFALKVYELLIPLAFVAALAEGKMFLGNNRAFLNLWGIFFFVSLFPTAVGYSLVLETDTTYLEWAQGRFAPLTNVIFHTGYLALNIMGLAVFLVCLNRMTLSLREFLRYWLIGTHLAIAYAIVLNLVFWIQLPLSLVGRFSRIQTINVGGVQLVRSGPFEEGNFFGLYLLLSLVLALWAGERFRDRFFFTSVPILAFGIFLTASPAAMALMLVLLMALLLRKGTPKMVRTVYVVVGAALLASILFTNLLQELVIEKFSLFLYGGIIDSGNVSLMRRINESYHAWMVWRDHPWGVGIGNFAFFWGNHPELYPHISIPFTFTKQIPNNVFLEIMSEQGIQGLILFGASLLALIIPLWRRREVFLTVSVLLMCVYFLVFPSFRLMFIWVFWAFLVYAGDARSPWRQGIEPDEA